MNKQLLLLGACLSVFTIANISADLIGGALNLARGAVDTAANVAEGAIDVVDEGTTRPIRGRHYHLIDEDLYEHGNTTVTKEITEEPGRVTVEKTVTTYEE